MIASVEPPFPQIVEVPGAFNLRDLGGHRTDSGIVAVERVYRSDLLHRVDETSGRSWLQRRSVTTVVDLRTTMERDRDGHLASGGGIVAHHVGLLDEVWSWQDEHAATDGWFLRDRTIEMFENAPGRIIEVLEILAGADGNVVFHCTAGKDRTGVVASALLGVLGATRQAIIADYSRSTDAMAGIIDWYRSQAPDAERDPDQERLIIERAASAATMAGVVDVIEQRHGSYRNWLVDVGGPADLVETLRRRFVISS